MTQQTRKSSYYAGNVGKVTFLFNYVNECLINIQEQYWIQTISKKTGILELQEVFQQKDVELGERHYINVVNRGYRSTHAAWKRS